MARTEDGAVEFTSTVFVDGKTGIGIDPASVGASVLGVKTGTVLNDAAVGGVLYETHTQAANVTTGETDLASYLVPASTLNVNGQMLRFSAFGTFANNGNTKRIRVQFTAGSGTTLVFDSSAASAHTNEHWMLTGYIVRTGAATEKGVGQLVCGAAGGGATGQAMAQVTTALNQTLSSAITLKVTGQGSASNDIFLESFVVEWADVNT